MARRGPAPKPRALRLLDGSHMERLNDKEPIPRTLAARCPEDVAPDVRAIWDYTVAELEHMGTVHACDRDSLVAYCEAVVNHRKSSRLLARSNILVQGALGSLIVNPALRVQRDSAMLIRQFAQEFGLTPSARTRIETRDVTGDGQENPFAGLG